MANKKYTPIDFSLSLYPTGSFPLDDRTYFTSYEEAENAAKKAVPAGEKGSNYYYGQELTVYENEEVRKYIIQSDNTLSPSGLVEGEGENSFVAGFETSAISKGAVALGYQTEAGSFGFEFYFIRDKDGKPDYEATINELYKNSSSIDDNGIVYGKYYLAASTDALVKASSELVEIEDKFNKKEITEFEYESKRFYYTVVLGGSYDYQGEITDAGPVDGKDYYYITVTNYIEPKLESIQTNHRLEEGHSYVFLPNYPHLGNISIGAGASADGYQTKARSIGSHAEGYASMAAGKYSHAEGRMTKAGYAAHAEGRETEALGENAHSEGVWTEAKGNYSHAEGKSTKALGGCAHAEGVYTKATGSSSHAEGGYSEANGQYSHAEGYNTEVNCIGYRFKKDSSLYEANSNKYYLDLTEAQWSEQQPKLAAAIDEDLTYSAIFTSAYLNKGKVIKCDVDANGYYIEVENYTKPYFPSDKSGDPALQFQAYSGIFFLEESIKAIGTNTFTFISSKDLGTEQICRYGHSEGCETLVIGEAAHAEGYMTFALGARSHTEGWGTRAYGNNNHAEGFKTVTKNSNSHAEGNGSKALGQNSHAEGGSSEANGKNSHAEGNGTITTADSSHAEGRFNIKDDSKVYAHILGNGTSDTNRSNAHTVDWNGNAWFAGDVFVGEENQDNKSKKLATEDWVSYSRDIWFIPYAQTNASLFNFSIDEDKTKSTLTIAAIRILCPEQVDISKETILSFENITTDSNPIFLIFDILNKQLKLVNRDNLKLIKTPYGVIMSFHYKALSNVIATSFKGAYTVNGITYNTPVSSNTLQAIDTKITDIQTDLKIFRFIEFAAVTPSNKCLFSFDEDGKTLTINDDLYLITENGRLKTTKPTEALNARPEGYNPKVLIYDQETKEYKVVSSNLLQDEKNNYLPLFAFHNNQLNYLTNPTHVTYKGLYAVGDVVYNQSWTNKQMDSVLKTVKYVSLTGDNTNSGNYSTSPYRTIQHAIDSGAEVIYVAPGTYAERITASNKKSLQILGLFETAEKAKRKKVLITDAQELTFSGDSIKTCVNNDDKLDTILASAFGNGAAYTSYNYSNADNSRSKGYLFNVWTEDNVRLKPVSSLELCKSTLNSWYYSEKTVYANTGSAKGYLTNGVLGTIDSGTTSVTIDKPCNGMSFSNIANLVLEDIEVWYPQVEGIKITKCHNVHVKACAVKGSSLSNGFSINASNGTFEDCRGDYNRNDGMNITGCGSTNFINCTANHNGDDGISHHSACTGAIQGGKYTNNGKGGVSPAHGATINCYDILSIDNTYGFYCVDGESNDYGREMMLVNCYAKSSDKYGIQVKNYHITAVGCSFKTEDIAEGINSSLEKYE